MAAVNKVIIVGRLGRDPELRQTGSGKAVANFSVAVSEKQGGQEKTTWFKVVAWEKQAENCAKYLSKGREVYVEGRLEMREWEDKEGVKRVSPEVVAFNVQYLGSGKDQPATAPAAAPKAEPDSLDDIPF